MYLPLADRSKDEPRPHSLLTLFAQRELRGIFVWPLNGMPAYVVVEVARWLVDRRFSYYHQNADEYRFLCGCT